MQPVPESIICLNEVKSLHEIIDPLFLELVSRCEVSDGDFHGVEGAIGDFIAKLRPLLVSSGLKVCMESSFRGYHCPQCEAYLTPWGRRGRHFVTSQGSADVSVVRYRCTQCSCDYYPVLEANGLTGTRFTLGARERIVSQATENPYADVSKALPELGITVSAKEVDRHVRQAFDYYEGPLRQEVEWYRQNQEAQTASTFLSENELAQLPGSSRAERILQNCGIGKPQIFSEPRSLFHWPNWEDVRWAQVSVDGAFVRSSERDEVGKLKWFGENSGLIRAFEPTREGAKQYRLDAQTFHVAGVMTLDDTFDRLFGVLEQCPRSVENVVYVSDDGQGLLTRAREYLNRAARRRFKQVILMLDCYHASQHVGTGAAAIWGADHETVKWWKENAISILKDPGGVQRILRTFLLALRNSNVYALADKEVLEREFRYLWRNRHYMKYALWILMGLPIGSGAMESGVKQVCVKRLRQPGMMWTKEGANAMLHLRAAHLSGILTTSFELEREEHRKKRNKFLAPTKAVKAYSAAV